MNSISSNSTDEAVKLALQGLWEQAIEVNKNIIEASPYDAEAHNRLGKALASIGLYEKAKESYENTLQIDPANTIAKKNIQRLSNLSDEEPRGKAGAVIDAKAFIEETGKSRIVKLYRVTRKDVLSRMSAGDHAQLQIEDQRLLVINDAGDYLGELDARTASRLIELMEGGNKYQVFIANIWDDELKVMIREIYQHPSQVGHPAFPPMVIDEPKPYLKDTLVRYDLEEDPSDEPDEPGDIGGGTEPEWEDEETIEENKDKDEDSDDDDLDT